MATNLRKYKYTGPSGTRPEAPEQSGSGNANRAATTTARQTMPEDKNMDTDALKMDIVSSLRADISLAIKEELKSALAETFAGIKSELQAIRAEIANNATATRTEIESIKHCLKDVEGGVSAWSDETTALQATVASLTKQVELLQDKCEDMEGRMRRGNIRIVGVPEHPGTSSPVEVSKLLKDVLQLNKEVKVDRSHRSIGSRKPGDRPRVIIAKLHYDGDCAEILRRARDRAPLTHNGNRIAIFPDYTTSVARARAAFSDVRKMLRGRQGIRYGLIYPAKFRISYNGEEKEFLNAPEAMDYVKKKFTEEM